MTSHDAIFGPHRGDLAVFDDEDSLAPEFVSLGYPCNVGEASTVNETELVTRGLVEHP